MFRGMLERLSEYPTLSPEFESAIDIYVDSSESTSLRKELDRMFNVLSMTDMLGDWIRILADQDKYSDCFVEIDATEG